MLDRRLIIIIISKIIIKNF